MTNSVWQRWTLKQTITYQCDFFTNTIYVTIKSYGYDSNVFDKTFNFLGLLFCYDQFPRSPKRALDTQELRCHLKLFCFHFDCDFQAHLSARISSTRGHSEGVGCLATGPCMNGLHSRRGQAKGPKIFFLFFLVCFQFCRYMKCTILST